MDAVQVGSIKTKFGIDGTTTFGLIESVTDNQTAEKLEVKNSQGQIIDVIFHGHKTEVSIEATFLTEDTATGPNVPAPIGTELSYTNSKGETVKGIIEAVSTTATSAENVKLSITATVYPSVVLA